MDFGVGETWDQILASPLTMEVNSVSSQNLSFLTCRRGMDGNPHLAQSSQTYRLSICHLHGFVVGREGWRSFLQQFVCLFLHLQHPLYFSSATDFVFKCQESIHV